MIFLLASRPVLDVCAVEREATCAGSNELWEGNTGSPIMWIPVSGTCTIRGEKQQQQINELNMMINQARKLRK